MSTSAASAGGSARLGEAAPNAPRRPLDSLQAGRGIAALLVVLYHAADTVFAAPKFWNVQVDAGLFHFGLHGVAFFFVLSGFIILHAHAGDMGRPGRFGGYVVKRAVRIYPPYWAVLFPLILIYTLRPELGRPDYTAPSVMLNSPLLIGLTNDATLGVAWTLFHEIAFYALFAVAIASRTAGLMLLAAWFVACAAILLVGGNAPHYALSPINLLFGIGMAARWWLWRRDVPAPRAVLALGILAFLLLGIDYDYAHIVPPAWNGLAFGLASGVIVLGGVASERQGRLSVPRALTQLGDASYAIYLVHFPALSLFARVFMAIPLLRGLPAGLSFVLVVAACVATGILFHRLIEKPLLSFLSGSSIARAGVPR